MRGKVAKKLRSLARAATVGAPTLTYAVSGRGDCIVVNRRSTRGVYLSLKRAFIDGRRQCQA